MKNASLVAVLSIAFSSLAAIGCNGQHDPFAGDDFDPVMYTMDGPNIPNGANPACLADPDIRLAIMELGNNRLSIEGTTEDGRPMLPKMSAVGPACRHVIKDILECALGDDQSARDSEAGENYVGRVGLATEWENRALTDQERRWISGCMVQRLNYFGISVPILLEGNQDPIAIDEELRQDYPFAESTAWGDIFTPGLSEFAWVCTEKDVWSLCGRDRGEPWIDTRVCDGVQNCGINFVGKCGDVCVEGANGYWDCSGQFGYTETVRVRMQTNTHEPILGACE